MTDDLLEVLEAENDALRAFDVVRATALLDRKQAAVAAFTASGHPAPALLARLGPALEENAALLRRAIEVQGRVLALVGRIASQGLRREGYGRSGTPWADPVVAVALRARA